MDYNELLNAKQFSLWKLIAITVVLVLQACALTPYEEEFACEGTDDYGRCTSVQGAYHQAVTGEKQGYPITKDRDGRELEGYSEGDEGLSDAERKKRRELSNYISYRAAMFQKMKKMITDPVTPMVKQPTVVRTLILNYETGGDGNPLFMHRFVYFFGDAPKWVMGSKNGQPTDSIVLPVLDAE